MYFEYNLNIRGDHYSRKVPNTGSKYGFDCNRPKPDSGFAYFITNRGQPNRLSTHVKFLLRSPPPPMSLAPPLPEETVAAVPPVVVLLLEVVMLLSASEPESELKGGSTATEEPWKRG